MNPLWNLLNPVLRRRMMNKSDLIETLGKETGLSKTKAVQVVELFFGEMSNVLANGDRVEIRGFCSIFVKAYQGYTGRNPKTGAYTQVLPKKLPFFTCGNELKERVDHT
jgi:integration host factor subunit beta